MSPRCSRRKIIDQFHIRFSIAAHTDRIGTYEYNDRLSERRLQRTLEPGSDQLPAARPPRRNPHGAARVRLPIQSGKPGCRAFGCSQACRSLSGKRSLPAAHPGVWLQESAKMRLSSFVGRSPIQDSPAATVRSARSRLEASMSLIFSSKDPAVMSR